MSTHIHIHILIHPHVRVTSCASLILSKEGCGVVTRLSFFLQVSHAESFGPGGVVWCGTMTDGPDKASAHCPAEK